MTRPATFLGMWMVSLALAVGCTRPQATVVQQNEPSGPPWFVDATDEVGLDFVNDPGPLPATDAAFFFPQIMAAGAALLDFDGDGRLDLYLLQHAGPDSRSTNRLYRQLDNGRFQDVSKGSGLDVAGHMMGVAVGDVNNDGRPDVLLTQYGGLQLYLNQGNGTFRDVTRESGLHNPLWGSSACFVDYDRDGRLDLVVVNYLDFDPSFKCVFPNGKADFCHPNTFPGVASRLFRNLGPEGEKAVRFSDVSLATGLGRKPGPGLGVYCADFNGDGWTDIFIANDSKPNHLWINQRDKGSFIDEAVPRGLAYNVMGNTEANMGVALGDADGDGLFDVFVTHLASETHTLWRQGPRGIFRDRTLASGLTRTRWRGTGFGTCMADFDLNGAPDLAIVNGHVARAEKSQNEEEQGSFWSYYANRNQLLANEGSAQFKDISLDNPDFTARARVARGLAHGDIDNDGDLDLVVTNTGSRARFYRNVAPRRGHWLMVRAIDLAPKGDALGAEVTIQAGNRTRTQTVTAGGSYLCANDPRVHFGLGEATTVEAIEVRWPDGSRERFAGGPVDRALSIEKGKGQKVPGG